MTTTLDEKDNQTCGICYLHSDILPICLLTGENVNNDNTCERWLAEHICKGCLIDFEKGY